MLKTHGIILTAALFASFTLQKDGLTESNYKIFSAKENKQVKIENIIKDMKEYNAIFFGEEHNDSVGHFLELEILKNMYDLYGNNIALSMEMFETDCQLVLNEYLKGLIRERNFVKEARAWNNYRDYKPLVEFAKEKKIDVIAANAPERYVNLATRKGRNALLELSDVAKSFLPPLPYDTVTADYYNKLQGVSHTPSSASKGSIKKDTIKASSMSAFQMLLHLIHSQSLWDATMAYSISQYMKKNKGKKVFQLNGKFHSDQYYGIVAQLKKYNPQLKVLVITTSSDENSFTNSDFGEYRDYGDYIILTDPPKVPKTFKNQFN